MEWVEDITMVEALLNADRKDFLFVTFIDGADGLSERLHGFFIDPLICKKIKDYNIKAFRIYIGTEEFEKFTYTYKTVPVPSIFVINHFGDPVDLITSDIGSTEALAEKLDRLIESSFPNLRLTSPHYDLATGPAYITELVSSSTSPSVSEHEIRSESAGRSVGNSEDVQVLDLQEQPIVQQNKESQKESNYEEIIIHSYEKESNIREYLVGGQDIELHVDSPSPMSFSKLEKEPKSQKRYHPPLANLLFRFESGDSRTQYFTYKTPLSTIRGYIKEVIQRECDITDFYMSTTFPSRVLGPEVDKICLEDLGLIPTAVINVHFNEVDRAKGLSLSARRTLLQRLGGLTTVASVALWIIFNPVMIGTNWLGLGNYLLDDEFENEGFLWNLFGVQEFLDE